MHVNIANRITAQAAQQPNTPAIIYPYKGSVTQLDFSQTESLINAYARGFLNIGIKKGDRVSLFVTPCLEFMPMCFALYKIGAILVLIDPGMGREGLLSCVQRIKPRVLIGIPKAMFASLLFTRYFSSVEIKVTVGWGSWLWGGYRLSKIKSSDSSPLDCAPTTIDCEASILFTSGSTGPAKGVRYTHGIFEAQTDQLQSMYDIKQGERDLPCFPLFGLFSLAMGMTVVIPEMDPTKPAKADPKILTDAIRTYNITNAFASPSLWKPFAQYCVDQKIELPTLQRILSAGAPIPPILHKQFESILSDGAQIHTPYGATESLPVATIGSKEVLEDTQFRTQIGEGTCVGHPVPDITVRIITINDDTIEQWSDERCLSNGDIGEICVQGAVVTSEYKEEPEHTKKSKIYDKNGTFWHRMGDLGYFDSKGRLWFCGRKSHRVQCEDGTLMFPVPCEAIFNQHPAVSRSALIEVDGTPIIIIEKHKNMKCPPEELLELGSKNPKTISIKHVLFHPEFPVDVRHNAKIKRLLLRDWAKEVWTAPSS
ncbi:MAG: hypothetical protein CL916_14815 [Deltaproteobacteria bacterium]|nr:hypothetical protein [Deltaproteobacteria bacterium]